MRSMMPVLMQHGYGRDDLEILLEDCHAAVSEVSQIPELKVGSVAYQI